MLAAESRRPRTPSLSSAYSYAHPPVFALSPPSNTRSPPLLPETGATAFKKPAPHTKSAEAPPPQQSQPPSQAAAAESNAYPARDTTPPRATYGNGGGGGGGDGSRLGSQSQSNAPSGSHSGSPSQPSPSYPSPSQHLQPSPQPSPQQVEK